MKILAITNSSETGTLPKNYPGWFEDRFGEYYAQISVDTTLKVKSAVKDVSRACRKICNKCGELHVTQEPISECKKCGGHVTGYVPPDIEQLTKKFYNPPQGVDDHQFCVGYTLDGSWVKGSSEPGHGGTDEALCTYIERYPEDWEIVKSCIGLPRQKGRHACAYLISNKKISSFVPLTSVGGYNVTAFTAEGVEGVGGIKMDFLVINSLRDIQDCIRLIQERHSGTYSDKIAKHKTVFSIDGTQTYDIWDLPDDQKVFADITAGNVESVFQLAKAARWLKYFDYKKIDGSHAISSVRDLAAFTALDRPGPLDVMVSDPETGIGHNALIEYARRARGLTPSPDILPILETMLPETYGILCFQEQLQAIYQNLTGCSGSDAEEFRNSVAKKKKDKVDAAFSFFVENASKQIGEENAHKMWDFLKTWAQYGFNMSHAVSYAVIAYACAWLKFYYPLEWWCSVLKNADKNDINEKFWVQCSKFISLPDLTKSTHYWEIHGDKVVAPVGLLHGVGEKANEQISQYAPYVSMQDFVSKIVAHRETGLTSSEVDGKTKYTLAKNSISRTHVYSMIVAGVMDSLFEEQISIIEKLEKFDNAMIEAYAQKIEEARIPELKKTWKTALTQAKNAKKTNYALLDSIGKYQARKKILPAYGEDLRAVVKPLIEEFECLSLLDKDQPRMRYRWKAWNRDTRINESKECPVIDLVTYEKIEAAQKMPNGGYMCAALGYIEDRDIFNYQSTKEAMSLLVDIGGSKKRLVIWPSYDTGKLKQEIKDEVKKGAVMAFLLHIREPGQGFSIKKYSTIREPLKLKAEEEDEQEK